jgi:hypothetical protein
MKDKIQTDLKLIRGLLLFFMISLFLSGVTAIPIESELSFLVKFFPVNSVIHQWLTTVLAAYREVKANHSFLLYGYDWLAFAHFLLAVLFIGPLCDPVRNIWVIEFGMIACLLIIPLALIAGPLRGIPMGWRLIDCSFGVFGILPLSVCYSKSRQLMFLQFSNQ